MARNPYPQCVGPSYVLDDVKAACQSAINCYPEKMDNEKWRMASSPGEVTIATLPGAIRATKNIQGRWFVVAGNGLYEVQISGSYVSRGTLATSSGHVGMDNNRDQLAIVDGPNLYIFTIASNTFTTITAPGWRGSNDVYEMDGYFIFVDPDTDQFYISAIDDGTMLDALDFSSADSNPDNIVTHRVNHRQVVFFGEDSTELWINDGAQAFPFVRYNSYTMDVGIVGKNAAINAADTLLWIGRTDRGTGIVYMSSGNQPSRVSTMAIERMLNASIDLSQATMWAYQIDGHEFVGINAPGLRSTLVYDAALQQWHERAEWVNGQWQPLRSRLVVSVGGAHFAGDDSGALVRLDPDANTLSDRPLVRERTWPHIVSPTLDAVTFYGLELAMKTGYGGVVTLQISNDSGENFGPMLQRPLGVTGRWMQRLRWNQLGTAFNRVFRIRCSDDVPFSIYQAAVDT